MHEHEAAAAEIAGAGQGDGEREAGRHGRIDRVAAALEDVEPDARRDALLCHHHAVGGDDGQRPERPGR